MATNPIYQNTIELTAKDEANSDYETIVQSNVVYQNDIDFTTTGHSNSIYGEDLHYNDEYLKETYGIYETPGHLIDAGILELRKGNEMSKSNIIIRH